MVYELGSLEDLDAGHEIKVKDSLRLSEIVRTPFSWCERLRGLATRLGILRPLCKQGKDWLPSYLVKSYKIDLLMASASHLAHS